MVTIKDRTFLGDPTITAEQRGRYRHSDWQVFRDSMSFAFSQTPLVQLGEYMAYQFEPLNAEFETMGMTEDPFNFKELAKQNISKEEWNAGPEGSAYYDKRIQYREVLTAGRVKILTDSLDREKVFLEFEYHLFCLDWSVTDVSS